MWETFEVWKTVRNASQLRNSRAKAVHACGKVREVSRLEDAPGAENSAPGDAAATANSSRETMTLNVARNAMHQLRGHCRIRPAP